MLDSAVLSKGQASASVIDNYVLVTGKNFQLSLIFAIAYYPADNFWKSKRRLKAYPWGRTLASIN